MRRDQQLGMVAAPPALAVIMTSTEAPEEQLRIVDIRSEPIVRQSAAVTEAPPKGRSFLTVLIPVTATLTVLAVWFLMYAFVLTGLEEHGKQARLYDRFRVELAGETAPLGGTIRPGAPVALISAPGLGGHKLVVVEGTTSGVLRMGPGHLMNTPLPGQSGTSVFLGRSVTFGGPFRHLSGLRRGERVTVTTGQGVFVYRVTDIRYPGERGPAPLAADQSRLTLVSSVSGGWRSGWAPSRAVFVDAMLVRGTVQPSPAGRPSSVSAASRPMGVDAGGLLPLILWLDGLVVAVALAVWCWFRWGRRQTWMVGVPVFVALLWGTSGALTDFLPNLL